MRCCSKIFTTLPLACLTMLSGQVCASQAWITGTIGDVHQYDSRWNTIASGVPSNYARILPTSGTWPAGCNGQGNIFRIKSDLEGQRMFKMLLLAKTLNSTVTISIDDANKDAGNPAECYLDTISF